MVLLVVFCAHRGLLYHLEHCAGPVSVIGKKRRSRTWRESYAHGHSRLVFHPWRKGSNCFKISSGHMPEIFKSQFAAICCCEEVVMFSTSKSTISRSSSVTVVTVEEILELPSGCSALLLVRSPRSNLDRRVGKFLSPEGLLANRPIHIGKSMTHHTRAYIQSSWKWMIMDCGLRNQSIGTLHLTRVFKK